MSPEWLHPVVFCPWRAGAAMFVIGLHQMNSPATARGGNRVSALGMTIAVGTTLLYLVGRPEGLPTAAWIIIVVGFLIGGGFGLYAARNVAMTAMPQLVSVFNAVGGGAAALVAIDDYLRISNQGQGTAGALVWDAWQASGASTWPLVIFGGIVAAGLLFGITMVLPIGGADMPVVISLLNSFTGTAAAMAGFVIGNPGLVIAGG